MINAVSRDRTNGDRPRMTATAAQGTNNIPKPHKRVPTQLARIELRTSPRTSRAKLVVMPQAGHGLPVCARKVQGGRPRGFWRCVPSVLAVPSSWYGLSCQAMKKTNSRPRATPARAPRTQTFRGGGRFGVSLEAGTIAMTSVRDKSKSIQFWSEQ